MSPDKESRSQSKSKESARAQNAHDKDQEKHNQKTASESKASNKSSSSGKSSQGKQTESRLPAGKSDRTTDHDTIRRWVEERGGSPAAVKATEKGDDPGLLRINFPGYSGEDRLEDISWEEFFEKFDEKKLAFLYQDETRGGETSRFWKFVSREGEHEKSEAKKK